MVCDDNVTSTWARRNARHDDSSGLLSRRLATVAVLLGPPAARSVTGDILGTRTLTGTDVKLPA